MEAFGLTASVISIATLAIQICDALKKAAEFWESFEDAPGDIRRISRELRFLANILTNIRQRHESGLNQDGHEQWIKEALELAKEDIEELASLISELARLIGPGNGRMKRHWGRVRIVLKRDKITKFKGYVESAKSILSLVQTSQNQSSMSQVNGKLEILAASFQAITLERYSSQEDPQNVPESAFTKVSKPRLTFHAPLSPVIKSGTNSCGVIQISTTQKSFNLGLGVLSLQSTAKSLMSCGNFDDENKRKDAEPTRKLFTVRFLCRFASCRRGFRLSTNDTFDSWTFNTIRRRPYDSEIFKLCRLGDTGRVRKRLDYGEASVFDVDGHGDSLLHARLPASFQMLADYGADIYLLHDENRLVFKDALVWGFLHASLLNSRSAPATSISYYATREDSSLSTAAKMFDIFIRHADLNPLDYWPNQETQVLNTGFGLPLEQLRYLLDRWDGFQFTARRWLDFLEMQVLHNIGSTETDQQSLLLLFSVYETIITRYEAKLSHFRRLTLLQLTVGHLLITEVDSASHQTRKLWTKIDTMLKSTKDLIRYTNYATILDVIIFCEICSEDRISASIRKWLKILRLSGINLHKYGRWEQQQHPAGLVSLPAHIDCCRTFHVEFAFGELEEDLTINVRIERKPLFSNLDPSYMCETGWRGELCLSRIDDAYIRDGRPLPYIPGSWHKNLKSNSELTLVCRHYFGWAYVDQVQEKDILWYDGWRSLWDEGFE